MLQHRVSAATTLPIRRRGQSEDVCEVPGLESEQESLPELLRAAGAAWELLPEPLRAAVSVQEPPPESLQAEESAWEPGQGGAPEKDHGLFLRSTGLLRAPRPGRLQVRSGECGDESIRVAPREKS